MDNSFLNNTGQNNNDGFDIEPSSPPMPPVSQPQAPPSFILSADKVQAVRFHPAKPGYEFRQVETFVDQVTNTLSFLESQIYQYQVDLHEKQDEVYDLQDTISKLKATIEVFRASGDPMTDASGGYVTASKLAETQQIENLTVERDALQQKVIELQEQLAETKNLLKDAEIEKEKLLKQLEEFKNNTISPSDLATLKAEKDILVEQLVQLKNKEATLERVEKELDEAKTKIEELEAAKVNEEELLELRKDKENLEQQIKELESSIENKILEERDALRKEIEKLNEESQVDILETEEYKKLLTQLAETEVALQEEKTEKIELKEIAQKYDSVLEQAAKAQEYAVENDALKARLKELENKLINSKPIEQDRELIKTLEAERNSLATQLAAAQDDADKGWQAHEELKNYVDNTLMPWIAAQNDTTENQATTDSISEATTKENHSDYNRLASSPEAAEMSIPYAMEEAEDTTNAKEEIKPAGAPLPRFLATAPEVLATMEDE